MKDKVLIIGGHELSANIAIAAIVSKGIENDVIVVDNKEDALQLLSEKDSYVLSNPYKDLPEINLFGGKPFKCKGKHQYREINGEWICECGRNIKD